MSDENPVEFESTEEANTQEEYEDDGNFENDIDINDEFQSRGRGRAGFR